MYHSQSPWTLETNDQAVNRPDLRVEEKTLVREQLKSGTNMRALLSALASGRAEIERMGKRQGWSARIMEEMLDRLQSLVRDPLQKGGDLIMSSIPYMWREQAALRVCQAEDVISSVTTVVTTKDWTLQSCQDYLVELEMVTSRAMMALRLTANDIDSDQVSQQVECISSRGARRPGTWPSH